MKLCVVAYKFGTEDEIGRHLGTYHYFTEKMRTLVKKGHEVYIVCPWLSFTKKGSEDIDGVKVIRYWPPLLNVIWLWPLNRIIRWIYFKKTQSKVLKTVKEKKVDLVYVWQARETGYAISKIKNKLGVPFYFRQLTAWHWHLARPINEVFSNKNWYQIFKKTGLVILINLILEFLLGRKAQLKFAKTIYDKADKIVFLSKAAIKEAKELNIDVNKTDTLGVAIEQDLFRPLGKKQQLRKDLNIKGSKAALFIGRINFAEKGIGYLLEAWKKVVVEIPQANLIIIGGGGESDRMNKSITALGLNENVSAVGKKPFADLPKYINAANVFVVPSVWMEAFGHVTIQAMSCGVPVVTFDAGASPEINIDGQTGFVVPSKDVDKLADSIIKIFQDEGLEKQLGQAARQRVLENYTYEAITNRFLDKILSL